MESLFLSLDTRREADFPKRPLLSFTGKEGFAFDNRSSPLL